MDERPAPTLDAARARVAAVRPGDDARSGNRVGGAVSGLSPYITYGLVTLTEALAGIDGSVGDAGLGVQHKFVYDSRTGGLPRPSCCAAPAHHRANP